MYLVARANTTQFHISVADNFLSRLLSLKAIDFDSASERRRFRRTVTAQMYCTDMCSPNKSKCSRTPLPCIMDSNRPESGGVKRWTMNPIGATVKPTVVDVEDPPSELFSEHAFCQLH